MLLIREPLLEATLGPETGETLGPLLEATSGPETGETPRLEGCS